MKGSTAIDTLTVFKVGCSLLQKQYEQNKAIKTIEKITGKDTLKKLSFDCVVDVFSLLNIDKNGIDFDWEGEFLKLENKDHVSDMLKRAMSGWQLSE